MNLFVWSAQRRDQCKRAQGATDQGFVIEGENVGIVG